MTEPEIKKQTYKISGMHCASCALVIEDKLKKLPGVVKAGVNYATQKAAVEYNGAQCDDSAVVKTVKDSGYEAVPVGEETDFDHDQAAREKEIRKERNTFILSLILTMPVIILSMILRDRSFDSKVAQSFLAGLVQFLLGLDFIAACITPPKTVPPTWTL